MNLLSWTQKFGTDAACRQYLFDQRWPQGFVCPQPDCEGREYWKIQRSDRTDVLYQCTRCHHQVSVTAGTLFHRTKVALPVWFLAIYRVAVDKGGVSALALSRELGVSYPTAWLMHHKIQQAMAERNARYQLGGLVELDDAYFGGVSHGPGTGQDPVVVGVSLTEHGHPQYVFLDAVESLQKEPVLEVLQRLVDQYGVWLSDGADIYAAGATAHQADLFHPLIKHDTCGLCLIGVKMAPPFYEGGRDEYSNPYSSEFKDPIVREVQETPNATLVARRHPLSFGMVRRGGRAARQQDRENGGMS